MVTTERVTTPANDAVNAGEASQTPAGRKRPSCTKCGKPMLGHRRGQCDAVSTPIKVKEEELDESKVGLHRGLTHELADLQLDKCKSEDEAAVIEKRLCDFDSRRRSSAALPKLPKADTLVSLTSNDKAILSTIGKPGMLYKDGSIDESAARAGIERWLDNVPPAKAQSGSRSKQFSGPPIESPRDFDAMIDLQPKKDEKKKRRSSTRSPKRLGRGRTSSAADRIEFFEQLAQKSKKLVASVFTIDMKDIQSLEENARRLKLHARIIAPKYADGSTGDGWLVIGSDERSVKELFAEVEKDVKGGRGYMKRLGDMAIGAAIAWTYFAFS